MARYHSLHIWHRAMEVLKLISEDLKRFRGEADIRDQIKRPARSTVANIAEGSGCDTKAGFRRYLVIARSSNNEVQNWYEISVVSGIIPEIRAKMVIDRIDFCGRTLSRFIRSLEEVA